MSQYPELTDDEDIDESIAPTSSDGESNSMSILVSPTLHIEEEQDIGIEVETPNNTEGNILIVSDIQEIVDDVEGLDFSEHRVSCNPKEKIIIALDRSEDEEVTSFRDVSDNKHRPLAFMKKAVEMFVNLKSMLNGQHEFALVLLEENKATWFLDFTNNVKEVLKALNSVKECNAEDIFDLTSLFHEISNKVEVPNFCSAIPPPYVVRTILLYNRSYTCPEIEFTERVKEMLDSPFFTLDVLVSHKPIDGTNNCEKIFTTLQNIDKKGFSYFFSVGRDINSLMRSMGKLLGHPLQRPVLTNSKYTLT